MGKQVIGGYDYRTQKQMSHSRAEWQVIMRAAIKAGAWRRAADGETFFHDARGALLFEIYHILDVRGGARA